MLLCKPLLSSPKATCDIMPEKIMTLQVAFGDDKSGVYLDFQQEKMWDRQTKKSLSAHPQNSHHPQKL